MVPKQDTEAEVGLRRLPTDRQKRVGREGPAYLKRNLTLYPLSNHISSHFNTPSVNPGPILRCSSGFSPKKSSNPLV